MEACASVGIRMPATNFRHSRRKFTRKRTHGRCLLKKNKAILKNQFTPEMMKFNEFLEVFAVYRQIF
jgi:hypothetical protein